MIEAKEIGLYFSQLPNETYVCPLITGLLDSKKPMQPDPNIRPRMLKTKLSNQYLKFYIDNMLNGEYIGYIIVNVDTHKIGRIAIKDKSYDSEIIAKLTGYIGYTVFGDNIFD